MADTAATETATEAKPEVKADDAATAGGEGDEAEGFGSSDILLDSVTKDEWKSIEAALSYNKKTVAEMLKRACAQVRATYDATLLAIVSELATSTIASGCVFQCAICSVRISKELALDDSNGKFLGDMLPEMESFASWCYKCTLPINSARCSRMGSAAGSRKGSTYG
eukprot:6180730-Pleurochrysis_carterae.AAC.1